MNRLLPLLFGLALIACLLLLLQGGGPGGSSREQDPAGDSVSADALHGQNGAEPSPDSASLLDASSVDQVGRRAVEAEAPDGPGADSLTGRVVARLLAQGGLPAEGAVLTYEAEGQTAQIEEDGRVRLASLPTDRAVHLRAGGALWVHQPVDVAEVPEGHELDLGEIRLRPGHLLTGRVSDKEGTPIPDAALRLQDIADPWPVAQAIEALSDAEGRYRFEGVPPGDYRLRVNCTGYLRLKRTLSIAEAPGTTSLDIQLSGGSVVRGRVVAANGAPISGATVATGHDRDAALLALYESGTGPESVTTDDDGYFTLSIRSDVMVSAEGYATTAFGQEQLVEPVVLVLEPCGFLRGRVVDAEGVPVADADITLDRMQATLVAIAPTGLNQHRASTGQDGTFTIAAMRDCDWTLRVESPAGRPLIKEPVRLGEEPLDLALRLEAAPTLLLRVVDERGAPVADAQVLVYQPPRQQAQQLLSGDEWSWNPPTPPLRSSDATDAEGFARFRAFDPGDYSLRIEAQSFALWIGPLEVTGQPDQSETVVLFEAGSLEILVQDRAATPLAGVRLKLVGATEDTGQSKTSDILGRAIWTRLQPGTYRVVHSERQRNVFITSLEEEPPTRPDSEAVEVEVASGVRSHAALTLATQALLAVEVFQDGNPVAGAGISLEEDRPDTYSYSVGARNEHRTDANGYATLPPTNPGPYRLWVSAATGSVPTSIELELLGGQQVETVHLPNGTVSGQVYGTEGPVAAARVHLVPEDDDEQNMYVAVSSSDDDLENVGQHPGWGFRLTDREGRFRFGSLQEGSYHIEIEAKGHSKLQGEPFLFPGGDWDLGVFTLEEEAAFAGQLPPGFDPTTTFLILKDSSGGFEGVLQAKPDGSFWMGRLAPGTYQLDIAQFGGDATGDEGLKSEPFEARVGEVATVVWKAP